MDDPFAALVEELNLKDEQPNQSVSIETNHVDTIPKNEEIVIQKEEVATKKEEEKEEEEEKPKPKPKPEPKPEVVVVEKEAEEIEIEIEIEEEEEEDDINDDENDFIESINNILSISELKSKFILFYKSKENEIYELKNKFTEISRRQKEVFIEVENRRKIALLKGKKYKQTASRLNYEILKLNNSIKLNISKIEELKREKKQRENIIEELTNNINLLKSNLNKTEQSKDLILDEFKQTHNVIDKLIQNEKIQEKLKCFIDIKYYNNENENKNDKNENNENNTNLSLLKLEFLDKNNENINNEISIQWNRSYFTDLIAIKNANKLSYKLSADDIGSIIKVEVRSKNNPECYETAILKNGYIKMNKLCKTIINENLLKITKQQIEFEIEPDFDDLNTSKQLTKKLLNNSKYLILHFNKDKIKLRNNKNNTIDKEQYNDSMKIILSSINTNRFSFKFSSTKKYVFLTKTSLERDNIAILLRCYIEKLKLRYDNNQLYLRLSNEKKNYEILNKSKGKNNQILTRDQLVSKILAPISSNPRIISPHSFNIISNPTLSNTLTVNPPISNTISTIQQQNEDDEFDVDEIFPDFNEQPNENKAWKKLKFVENATIASVEKLKQNAIVPAPMSSKSTKTKK